MGFNAFQLVIRWQCRIILRLRAYRIFLSSMVMTYVSMQSAIPETTAEQMKMTGISGVIQSALALTEPKMKPA